MFSSNPFSVAADQSSSVSFLHLLYCVPGGALVTWNGRAGIMALQIPLSQHSWAVSVCLAWRDWHVCADLAHSLVSLLVIPFLNELESDCQCGVCWSHSTVKRFPILPAFSSFSVLRATFRQILGKHSLQLVFLKFLPDLFIQGEPRGGRGLAIVGGSCWRNVAEKSVTSAGSSSGAVLEHGIRAAEDGEAQGSRGGRWRRMWGLGCWGALERTWEDMAPSLWEARFGTDLVERWVWVGWEFLGRRAEWFLHKVGN